MATGFKDTVANSLLNAVLRNTSYTGPAGLFIQLHTAAPGAAGTSNVATNSTRKSITFNAASGGVSATSADVTWTSVPASETYTFFTLWDASSAGNFIGSGTLTMNGVSTGDTAVITAGNLTVTENVAS